MLVFKPCENLLLIPPKFFTTTTANSKPHLLHHHDVKLLHFSPLLKPHFKSTLSSSPLSSAAAPPPPPSKEDSSSSSLKSSFFSSSNIIFSLSLSLCLRKEKLHKSSSVKSMLVFKPCENLLLFPPKIFTTTNSKPHLLHLHHHHHHHVRLLHFSPLLKPHFKSTLSSPLSSVAPPPPPSEEDSSSSSLTTIFLMDSGGLSYVQALQVIQQAPTLLRKGGRRPRSVIAYFESIGFSKTHISEAISKYPRVLVADVEKTLKPKIQLFLDLGFSESDIAYLTALQPSILTKALKTHLKPALDLVKSIVKTDEDLIKAIKRNSFFLLRSINHRKWIEPNMDVLRKHGVPDSEILHLVLSRLQTLMLTPQVFKSIVERIVSLGFKPETRMFSTAVLVMSGMNKAIWDSKFDLLKGLGWSEVQILDAFRRLPSFLKLSLENMKESIEFFKESLNWDASVLSLHPMILNYSLKGRVIPRYAVLKCLMSKEIIKEDKIFVVMLTMNETQFLSKYVFKYQDQLPYLYERYTRRNV